MGALYTSVTKFFLRLSIKIKVNQMYVILSIYILIFLPIVATSLLATSEVQLSGINKKNKEKLVLATNVNDMH